MASSHVEEEARSEFGDMYAAGSYAESGVSPQVPRPAAGGAAGLSAQRAPVGVGVAGVVRDAAPGVRMVGRGPVAVDPRKFKYDRTRGHSLPALAFGASKADRLDAGDAGEVLHRIHTMLGIANESEDVLVAFDRALFFEHTINGASLLQPGRGVLSVGNSVFELATIKQALGTDQRRFFRAYADEIADVNRGVVAAYDPYDPVAAEKHGQLMQVAIERGLQKFAWLAHDSSDAGLRLSVEERIAIMGSKRVVLESVVNNVDKITPRVAGSSGSEREI